MTFFRGTEYGELEEEISSITKAKEENNIDTSSTEQSSFLQTASKIASVKFLRPFSCIGIIYITYELSGRFNIWRKRTFSCVSGRYRHEDWWLFNSSISFACQDLRLWLHTHKTSSRSLVWSWNHHWPPSWVDRSGFSRRSSRQWCSWGCQRRSSSSPVVLSALLEWPLWLCSLTLKPSGSPILIFCPRWVGFPSLGQLSPAFARTLVSPLWSTFYLGN